MSKIFLVSQGSYSDYEIVAVFSTEEKARDFVRRADERASHDSRGNPYSSSEMEVEEYELDAQHEWPDGAYVARVDQRGVLLGTSWLNDEKPNREAQWQAGKYSWEALVTFTGYGETREHARRSAEECRRAYLTSPAGLTLRSAALLPEEGK